MVVYLRCEFTARDLDARLLIASYLLQEKQPVVIGQMWGIASNAGYAPLGPALFSSANRFQGLDMERFKSLGYPVLGTDEEILAIQDEQEIVRTLDHKAASNCDLFLLQDIKHETLIKQAYPGLKTQLCGSARVELLNQHRYIYERDAKKCRQSGRYILFNTNFSLINAAWGSLEKAIAVTESSLDPEDKRASKDLYDAVDRQTADLEAVKHLIGVIRKRLPSYRIVLRPHPSERPEYWADAGIEVIEKSNPIPWMLGADLVIHTGSTTGYEAALLGVACLNVGVPHDYFKFSAVNCSIPNREEAGEAIVAFLSANGGPIAIFKVPVSDLVPDGAKNIAAALLRASSGLKHSPIDTWGTIVRTPEQVRKFSVPLEAFLARLGAVTTPKVPFKLDVTPLDDSLFLVQCK